MDSHLILQDKFLGHFFKSEFGPRFYLTGGTALARFYFRHRESLDLDLFTNEQEAVVSRKTLSIFIGSFSIQP